VELASGDEVDLPGSAAENFGLRPRVVEVPEAGSVRADFQESRGGELTVQVGAPGSSTVVVVPGAQAIPQSEEQYQAFRDQGSMEQRAIAGACVFRGLPEGTYTVLADLDGSGGDTPVVGQVVRLGAGDQKAIQLSAAPP
jgi:hypothetical protein